MKNEKQPEDKSSLINVMSLLAGILLLLVALLGILNTAMGWELKLEVYGSGTDLPKHWDAAIGLLVVALIWLAIYALLTYVRPIRDFGRRRPWILALIVLGGLVGVIVGITIWDNGNIAERRAAEAADAKADSLDRIAESKVFFEDGNVPYRLAVLNPEAERITVFADSVELGSVAPYQGAEFQLPWKKAKLEVLLKGKFIATYDLVPDTTRRDAAVLNVYSPQKKLDVWLFDYDQAYVNGKLAPAEDYLPEYVDSRYHDEFWTVEKAGPFYVLPGMKAPDARKYHCYRFVLLPAIEEPRDNRPFAAWAFKHVDGLAEGAAVESPEAMLAKFQAE